MRILLFIMASLGLTLLAVGWDFPAGILANTTAGAFVLMFGGGLLLLVWSFLRPALIERSQRRRNR